MRLYAIAGLPLDCSMNVNAEKFFKRKADAAKEAYELSKPQPNLHRGYEMELFEITIEKMDADKVVNILNGEGFIDKRELLAKWDAGVKTFDRNDPGREDKS